MLSQIQILTRGCPLGRLLRNQPHHETRRITPREPARPEPEKRDDHTRKNTFWVGSLITRIPLQNLFGAGSRPKRKEKHGFIIRESIQSP